MADLNQVKGINARQIKLLQESGISNAEALAMSPNNVVADIDGLGDKTAKKLIHSIITILYIKALNKIHDFN